MSQWEGNKEVGLAPYQTSGIVNGQYVERPEGAPTSGVYVPPPKEPVKPTEARQTIETTTAQGKMRTTVYYPGIEQRELDRQIAQQVASNRRASSSLNIAPQPRIEPVEDRLPTYEVQRGWSKATEVRPYRKGEIIGDIFGVRKTRVEPGMRYKEDILGFVHPAGKATRTEPQGYYDFKGERLDQAGKILLFSPFAFGSLPPGYSVTAALKSKSLVASEDAALFPPIPKKKPYPGQTLMYPTTRMRKPSYYITEDESIYSRMLRQERIVINERKLSGMPSGKADLRYWGASVVKSVVGAGYKSNLRVYQNVGVSPITSYRPELIARNAQRLMDLNVSKMIYNTWSGTQTQTRTDTLTRTMLNQSLRTQQKPILSKNKTIQLPQMRIPKIPKLNLDSLMDFGQSKKGRKGKMKSWKVKNPFLSLTGVKE